MINKFWHFRRQDSQDLTLIKVSAVADLKQYKNKNKVLLHFSLLLLSESGGLEALFATPAALVTTTVSSSPPKVLSPAGK